MATETRQRSTTPVSDDAWLDDAIRTPGRRLVDRVGPDAYTRGYTEQTPAGAIEVQLATGERLPAEELRDAAAVVGLLTKARMPISSLTW